MLTSCLFISLFMSYVLCLGGLWFFPLAVICLSVYVTILFLKLSGDFSVMISLLFRKGYSHYVLPIIYGVCMLLLLTKDLSGLFYLNFSFWYTITSIPSLLLAVLFPGFAILSVVGRSRFDSLGLSIKLIAAYIISITFTAIIGIGASQFGGQIFGNRPLLFLGHTFLLFAWILANKKRNVTLNGADHKFDLPELAAVICLCILIFALNYYKNPVENGKVYLAYDQANILGESGFFYNNGIPPSMTDGSSHYLRWWFEDIVAVFFAYNGLPVLDSLLFLSYVSPLVIIFLAYVAFKAIKIVNKRSFVVLFMVLALMFSGFGWSGFLFLSNTKCSNDAIEIASWKTYDIYFANNFLIAGHPDAPSAVHLIIVPLFLFSLVLLTAAVGSVWEVLLFSLIFLNIMLSHIPETVIVCFTLLFYAVLSKVAFKKNFDAPVLGMTIGSTISIGFDILSPYGKTFMSYPGNWLFSAIPLLGLIVLIMNRFNSFSAIVSRLLKRLAAINVKKIFLFVSVGLYVFAVIAYLWVLDDFSTVQVRNSLGWTYVPSYIYPVKLGILGILTIGGIFIISKKPIPKKTLLVFLSASASVLIINIMLWHVLGYVIYDEFRFLRYLGICLSFFAAVFISHISDFIIKLRRASAFSAVQSSKPLQTSIHSRKLLRSFAVYSILLSIVLAGTGSSFLAPLIFKTENAYFIPLAEDDSRLINSIWSDLGYSTILVLSDKSFHPNKISIFDQLRTLSVDPQVIRTSDIGRVLTVMGGSNVKYLLIEKGYLPKSSGERFLVSLSTISSLIGESPNFCLFKIPRVESPAAEPGIAILIDKSPLLISDDNGSLFWSGDAWGSGTVNVPILKDDPLVKVKGSDGLLVDVGKGNNAYWRIIHDYGTGNDWSGENFINLYWEGHNTTAIFALTLETSPGNQFNWLWTDDYIGWKRIQFSLHSCPDKVGNPTLSSVRYIYISCRTANLTGSFNLDNGFLDTDQWFSSAVFPLIAEIATSGVCYDFCYIHDLSFISNRFLFSSLQTYFDNQNLLDDWISMGGTAILVADKQDRLYDFPTNHEGKGNIEIINPKDQNYTTIFDRILTEIRSVISLNTLTTMRYANEYSYAAQIECYGRTKVAGDAAHIVLHNPIDLNQICSYNQIPLNERTPKMVKEIVTYGEVNMSITTNYLKVTPYGLWKYIALDDLLAKELEIVAGKKGFIELFLDGGQRLSLSNTSIHLENQTVHLIAKKPSITVEGYSTFRDSKIWSKPNQILDNRQGLSIQGVIDFELESSSCYNIIISNFRYEGKIL